MKTSCTLLLMLLIAHVSGAVEAKNPRIDYAGFKDIVIRGESLRDQKRLSEADFLAAIKSSDFILLDARSAANFNLRHIKGAKNLPFTEFTAEALEAVLPTKESKILIYCNNNFLGSPAAFASKSLMASLNVYTQASLRAYGYENIYELGPLLDVSNTVLPFEGSELK